MTPRANDFATTSRDNEHLRDFLADRDEPCPLCRYNLRNLQNDRCPECGRVLRLTVGLADPVIGAWVAVLVATLLPAAFGLVLAITVALDLFRSYGGLDLGLYRLPLPEVFTFVHVLAAVPVSAAVLACRRRFLKWHTRTQTVCVVAAWGANCISIACIIYLNDR